MDVTDGPGPSQTESQSMGGASLIMSQSLDASHVMSQPVGRVLQTSQPGSASPTVSQSVGGASQVITAYGPLRGFTVYIIGQSLETSSGVIESIKSLGGMVVSEVTTDTTICLSNEGKHMNIALKN